MFIDTFVRIQLRGVSLASLTDRYADWILGTDGGIRSRQRRLEEGVGQDWSRERMLAAEPLIGHHGCRVDLRMANCELLVRFVHRDTRDGAVFWNTVARVTAKDDTLFLEHAIGRDVPKGQRPRPIAAAPRVITGLLEQSGVEILPRELRVPLATLHPKDVRGYVSHELLRKDRQAPIVVVSCSRGGEPPVVEADRLAHRLQTLGSVVVLATTESTFEFSDVLEEAGLGSEFRCFNGAVHLYGPTEAIEQDHRLWLADTMMSLPDQYRTDHLAGLIASRIGVRDVPSGFFTLIEDHDRKERRRLAERLSKKPSSPPPSAVSARSPEYVREVETELQQLRVQLQQAIYDQKGYEAEWIEADASFRLEQRQREDAEARLEQERALSADLRDKLDQMKRSKATLPPETVDAFGRLLTRRHSPEDCLQMIGTAFPDRVFITESAISSAKKAQGFRHTDKLAELLGKLVTTYFEALRAGKSDAEGARIFGEAFAAKESASTMGNPRARTGRTFRYKGEELVMWRHLRVGTKDSTAETIRVHFDWIADEQKLVLGWCGEHRYVVG